MRREAGTREEGYRDRVVTRLRRLNITVNRTRRNSDAGAGATRKTSIKMARLEGGGGRG